MEFNENGHGERRLYGLYLLVWGFFLCLQQASRTMLCFFRVFSSLLLDYWNSLSDVGQAIHGFARWTNDVSSGVPTGVTVRTRLKIRNFFRHYSTGQSKKFRTFMISPESTKCLSVGGRRRPVGLHSPSGCRVRVLDILQSPSRVVRLLLEM